ncbi:glycerol-3-phosphate 1-O-acyltransferase PlsY [Pelistega sp. MC2]|uniref:glycerol-3-phosphate 1-O-acyltransferase PlsY n=1 Tax=Pelistega sp. MC2 TaxID=1720297 RepID=UPI0008DAC686|nr:glycerol-3-phosphate 1-O-acyltransferase PlsY [Pelistega sp. MC2]
MSLTPTLILAYVFAIFIAYLMGSIPFAILVSRLFGLQDPRHFGSGNPGATNVLRSGNKKAAILTLIGDAFKGWLAVFITSQFFVQDNLSISLVAVAAFLGHVYSIFLGFKGGKGVATGIGVLLGLDPSLALILIVIWLLVALLFKYSSLAALVAAASAPFLYLTLNFSSPSFSSEIFVAIAFISLFLIYKHKKNIHNLLIGKESKIGQKKK